MMKNIKKICVVWESIEQGGVNSYLRDLILSNNFKSSDITIFTNRNNLGINYLKQDLAKRKKIKIKNYLSFFTLNDELRILKILIQLISPIFFIYKIFKFKRLFKNKKFDFLIAQCGNYGTVRSEQAAIIAARLSGIRVTTLVIHHECRKPPIFTRLINYLINQLLKKYITSVICVSKATMKSLKIRSNLLTNSKFEKSVIHNGIPITNLPKKNYLKNIIKINKKDINICMLSRITPNKGQNDLIESFSKLEWKIQKKIKIYLIGNGKKFYKLELKKKIHNLKLEKKIFIFDYINLDSSKIISSFDLFISLTKDYEGFGLSIAEAMNVKTPIIATNVGAVNEFFNNNCGRLIEPNNSQQLKNSLKDFVNNKGKWFKKAEFAKKTINKNFSDYVMSKNYFNHFAKYFKK